MKITPVQRKFLLAALADDGRITRPRTYGRAGYWLANEIEVPDKTGSLLRAKGFIEQIRADNGTAVRSEHGGFLYRITDRGRDAVRDPEALL